MARKIIKIDKKIFLKFKTPAILNFFFLAIISLLGIVLILPILSLIPAHPDEYQFLTNAFKIMAGLELHNYLHIAFTEYLLAGFFCLVNMFTNSGVNYPQGEPSLVTYYYCRIFGLILYLTAFVFSCLILQRGESKVKLRTIIFGVFYFGSLGLIERFLRVNSDSTSILIFLNFFILSIWLHRQKASAFKFFLLNLVFIFLGSFTNIKSLFMMAPLVLVNVVNPLLCYRPVKKGGNYHLPNIYRFILSVSGTALGAVLLWGIFIPRPFNPKTFWYTVKYTIVYGTKFDFNYPAVAYGSWKVYIFDTLAYQIGIPALLAVFILTVIAYKFKGRSFFGIIGSKIKNQLRLAYLKEGELEKMTEVILFASAVSYYFGVSSAVIHYSRWGAPIGILAVMILSTLTEKILEIVISYKDKIKLRLVVLLPLLVILSWSLRFALEIDTIQSNYLNSFKLTGIDVDRFLKKEGVKPEDYLKKAAWFGGGYSGNITGALSLEQLPGPQFSEVKYFFWPFWATGQLYTTKNVDKSAHNQIAFAVKYAEKTYFRFPTILSRYIYATTKIAWKYFQMTWWPEVTTMMDNHYGVIKFKDPVKSINLVYEVPFKDMSHYYFPYSLIFNIPNLPDGYMFPPCYGYSDVKLVKNGVNVDTPPGISQGARTAGLYCHSVRFRMFFKGKYKIRIEGLPDDPKGVQRVFTNLKFDWDVAEKAMLIDMPFTVISGDFGVAIPEKNIRNLKFIVSYNSY